MAAPIVSWGGNDHIVSHSLSKTQSMVSFDFIPSDKPETPGGEGAPRVAEFRTKHMGSRLTGPSGTRMCTSTCVYPEPQVVHPMVHSCGTTGISLYMETLHFWCVVFSDEVCERVNSSQILTPRHSVRLKISFLTWAKTMPEVYRNPFAQMGVLI